MSARIETGLLSIAITPKTTADQERLDRGLRTLVAEDPTLKVKTGWAPGEVVIGAIGEQHLEIVIDRLRRDFNVEASIGRPEVAYKETVTRAADGERKFANQIDGRGQYGHVKIHLYPRDPGTGYVFENRIPHDAMPQEFIDAIDEGIREALTLGVLAGYPVDDVRIEVYDGSYHAVDSSKTAFRIAASLAFQDAAKNANPVLLEPVMRVEVVVLPEYVDDIVANLSSRRGRIESRENRGGAEIVTAHVPLSEMFGYAVDLRSRTFGRATFAMRFARYQPVRPPGSDRDDTAMVTAPLTPGPTLRQSSVALPEPLEDDLED